MDLTRLYNLTTPELRHEAERLGVTDTYAMSRGQLIHAIRNEVEGPPPEGFFGKVLGFAKWALAAAEGPGHGPEPEPVPEPAPEPVPEPATSTANETASVNESANVTGSGTGNVTGNVPVTAPVAVPVSAAVPVSVTAPVAVPVSAPVPGSATAPATGSGTASGNASGSATATGSQSGPPSRPPAGVFSKGASVFQEPFPTRTMARILAEQGHFKRSLAIYDTLLRDEPSDVELSAEVENVRARSRARRSHV